MSDRIDELESRISELEEEVRILKTSFNKSENTTTKHNSKEPIPVLTTPSKPIQHGSKILIGQQPQPKKEIDYERLIGQIWLPRVFILVLILGVLWGFKAMVDIGFITEPIRLVFGYAVSLLLIWLGEKQIKNKRGTLGQVLLGGSVVILILTTFAGNVLYDIFPGFIALVLNVIWVVLGIYLSEKHHSQPIAILSSIAGFLAPFLVEGAPTNIYLFVGYEVLFFIALLHFSLLKKYVVLYFTSGIFLHVALLSYIAFNGSDKVVVLGILAQHIFLLLAFLRKEVFISQQKGTLFTSFILTQIWVSSLDEIDFTLFLTITFVIYLGLSYIYRSSKKLHTMLPIATYALALLLADLADYDNVGTLLLIQGTISIFAGITTRGKLQTVIGTGVYFIGASQIFFAPIESIVSYESLSWVLLILSVFVIRMFLVRYKSFYEKALDFKSIMNLVFGVIAFLLLIFITQMGLAATDSATSNVQSLTVSTLWAIYSIVGVIYGVLKDNKKIRLLGIILLFLTLLKIIFVDIESVSIFVRAILFMGLGTIGIVLSRFFYSNKK